MVHSPGAISPAKPRPGFRRPPAPSAAMAYLSRAAALPGKSLALAAALVAAATSARSPTVSCGRWVRAQFALSPDAVCDGLTRLEAAGLIQSYWGSETSGARRRYYAITALGQEKLISDLAAWEDTKRQLDQLLEG